MCQFCGLLKCWQKWMRIWKMINTLSTTYGGFILPPGGNILHAMDIFRKKNGQNITREFYHYFLLLQNDQYFVYVFAGWIITLALILLIAWRKRQMINGILCSEFLLLNIPHLCEKLSDTFLLLKWINIFQERNHVAQFEPI